MADAIDNTGIACMDKKTLFSWKPQQLSQLFNIGSDAEIPTGEKLKSDYLDRILSQNLPLDKTAIDLLPVLIRPFSSTMGFFVDEPLITFLLNPVTNPDLLRQVKKFAKNSMSAAVSSAQREAAAVVYYAAIAGALLLYGQRISRLSYHQLVYTFSQLKEKKWILAELRTLFGKACIIAKEKETGKTS
jgi:hypothetical protein